VRPEVALERQFTPLFVAAESGDAGAAEALFTALYSELHRLAERQLARVEPELAQLVDLKYFCGFSFAEIAALRGITERTVQRHWERARLYLHAALEEAP
jgi:DNA-directed RNA polymerase specialized sigma24 family protein